MHNAPVIHSTVIEKRRFWIAVLIAVLAGLLLRGAIISAAAWRIDYDEAMIGLLGLRVLRGDLMLFVPAQSSLGAIEPYLLAPLFAVFGATPFTLRGLSLLLSAAYIVSTALLGRSAFDSWVGLIAAILAALAPPYLLITGMKIWGGTIETIILGNILLLTVAWAIDGPRKHWAIGLGGFVAGLMFWVAWLGFYYLIPAAVILLWRGRNTLITGWWVGVLAFFLGSAPFWIYNLTENFSTFTDLVQPQAVAIVDHRAIFQHLLTDLAPRLVTEDGDWFQSRLRWKLIRVVIYYAGLVTLLLAPFWWRAERGRNLRWLLIGLAVTIPIVYVFSGFGNPALNPWGIDATGRYALMLHTALPLGVAVLARGIARWLPRVGVMIASALIVTIVGLNMWSAIRLDPVAAFSSAYYDRLPQSLDSLIDYLDDHEIRHVWTDAGVAHVLMFETQEHILAADYYDAYLTDGFVRFPDALAAVEQAQRTAFVVPVLPGQVNPPVEQALRTAEIDFMSADVLPTLRVYVPDEQVDPSHIAAGLGYQY